MTRHVVVPALIAAGIGVCAFLIGYAMILAGQAMSDASIPAAARCGVQPTHHSLHRERGPDPLVRRPRVPRPRRKREASMT